MFPHTYEIKWCADLLIIIPARNMQHRDIDPVKFMLVAERLPEIIKPGMLDLRAPIRNVAPCSLIHRHKG